MTGGCPDTLYDRRVPGNVLLTDCFWQEYDRYHSCLIGNDPVSSMHAQAFNERDNHYKE